VGSARGRETWWGSLERGTPLKFAPLDSYRPDLQKSGSNGRSYVECLLVKIWVKFRNGVLFFPRNVAEAVVAIEDRK
jgi:hypothetical protein